MENGGCAVCAFDDGAEAGDDKGLSESGAVWRFDRLQQHQQTRLNEYDEDVYMV